MFDISLTEILLVLVVAVIFLGPEEIPRIVKMLAKVVRSIRYISGEVRRAVEEVIDIEDINTPGRKKTAPRKFILDDHGNYREIYDMDDFLPEQAQVKIIEHAPPEINETKPTAP